MLQRLPVERGVRLVGVGVAGLLRDATQQQQLSFDDDDDGAWDAANGAVDAIRGRYGAGLIGPARLAGRGERSRSAQWGPDSSTPSSGDDRTGPG